MRMETKKMLNAKVMTHISNSIIITVSSLAIIAPFSVLGWSVFLLWTTVIILGWASILRSSKENLRRFVVKTYQDDVSMIGGFWYILYGAAQNILTLWLLSVYAANISFVILIIAALHVSLFSVSVKWILESK